MQAKKGDVVKVHYKGTLADGTVFDSSEGKEPLSFIIGQGHVIPGFENGIEGMAVGDKKTLNIPCAEAYGELVKEAVFDISAGSRLVLLHPETGEPMPVTIVKAEDGKVTLDGNHPLSGEALTFDVTLESISETDDCASEKGGECCGGGNGGCGCDH